MTIEFSHKYFAALKQQAYDKFIAAPIGSDDYGAALAEYGHAVEDEYRSFFNIEPKWTDEARKLDLAKVTRAHQDWMCFEAASRGYKFNEAAEARARFNNLAREYMEKYGITWDGKEPPKMKPATSDDCAMFKADGLTPEAVRILYGAEAERVYCNWIYLNLK